MRDQPPPSVKAQLIKLISVSRRPSNVITTTVTTNSKIISPTSSTPITTVVVSKLWRASRPTNTSAKSGLISQNDSDLIPSIKCRD